HIWALHVPGNNNPLGVNVKSKADTVPFHPYYTVKDGFAIIVYLILFAVFVFFLPHSLGRSDNYIPANPLQTPPEIVPEWYLLPFYAMLRAVPNKLLGVVTMFGSLVTLFLLPWLDRSKVRSMRYRPTMRWFFIIFFFVCIGLAICGANPPDKALFGDPNVVDFNLGDNNINSYVWLSRVLTLYYFAFFWIIMPFTGWFEKTLPVPDSISTPVLPEGGAVAPAE